MTNQQIIDQLSRGLIARVNLHMSLGRTKVEAMAAARESSTAGPAVWAIVDRHFNNHQE